MTGASAVARPSDAANPVFSAEQLNRFLSDFDIEAGLREARSVQTPDCIDLRLENELWDYSVLVFDSDHSVNLDYISALLDHLEERGITSPIPLQSRSSQRTAPLGDRVGALLALPAGSPAESTTAEGCRELGALLGRFHRAASDFGGHRESPRGPLAWRRTMERSGDRLPEEQQALLSEELRFQGLYRFVDLPRGTVHGSPEPGNVLFTGKHPHAFAGLGAAGSGILLFDLAIAANAWCTEPVGDLDPTRVRALLGGYHQERALSPIERGAWPVMIRSAVLDRWLAALECGTDQAQAALSEHYARVLSNRIESELMLQLHWV